MVGQSLDFVKGPEMPSPLSTKKNSQKTNRRRPLLSNRFEPIFSSRIVFCFLSVASKCAVFSPKIFALVWNFAPGAFWSLVDAAAGFKAWS